MLLLGIVVPIAWVPAILGVILVGWIVISLLEKRADRERQAHNASIRREQQNRPDVEDW